MKQSVVLIVDDEPDILELLALTLERMGILCHPAKNLTDAKCLLKKHTFNLCLTDMRLPDGNGIDLVKHIQKYFSDLPVAVITAHGSMVSAVEALKAGAFDFVSKPVDLQVLRNLVQTALKLSLVPAEKTVAVGEKPTLELLGASAVIQSTRSMIDKLARSQAPVYISGESGSGKELAARLIHEKSARRDFSFVPVNCGAIPQELMESEFFGHKKGSFTGAVSDKEGLFQAASGGTLFLDEVADLPLQMQVKLLRAIQEKAVRPVGEQKEQAVDVRILCATHKNLSKLVEDDCFRQDLFYRINVIELHMPSLRERPEDIPLLVDYFLTRLAEAVNEVPPVLSEKALAALKSYIFPGNVRELENILERAMTLSEGEKIELEDLQLPELEAVVSDRHSDKTEQKIATGNLDSMVYSVEKETIIKALEQARYNKTAAARILGISFGALRYRLKKLDLA
ncbi:MAG TPA: sigma-54-dependent Fis family transcriptional regulator [Crenotrichaceae bacterium]|nr:sigma-54-dependent Fis family transcriptional regulator [Crenotrichaceae bacterium]